MIVWVNVDVISECFFVLMKLLKQMQWKMNNDFCGICFIELVFFIDREIEFSYV